MSILFSFSPEGFDLSGSVRFRPIFSSPAIGCRAAGLLLMVLTACSPFHPAEVLYKRDALYNFLEEGFLSSDILQSAGTSTYRSDDGSLSELRARCMDRAHDMALDRMVSMLLHTKMGVKDRSGQTSGSRGDFRTDYPRHFSDRELLLASTDFADLLEKHFIAFQDFSQPGRCQITIRIIEPGLGQKIRSHTLSFQPTP